MNNKKFYNLKKFNLLHLLEPISRQDHINFSNFERKKYEKLLKLLTFKLNELHNKSYKKEYWDRIIGHFLLYHLTCCSRYFNSRLKNINSLGKKKISILDQKSFYIPSNTSDYRNCFQHSYFGQEQMFSNLIRFFFKNKKFIYIHKKFIIKQKKIKNKENNEKLNYLFYRIANFFFRIIFKNKNKYLATRCFWTHEARQKIQFFFKGKFLYDNYYIPKKIFLENMNLRDKISSLNDVKKNVDNFDKFFFYTLKFCIPKSFIEEYRYKSEFSENYLDKNKNLKFIINESMDEDNMFLIAHAKLNNIKSIYCEHNYLQHSFVGNLIKFIKKKFDYFFTLGWKSKNIQFKPAGSFFNWVDKNAEDEIKFPILFVPSVTLYRKPFTSSAYGESGEFNSLNYVKMNLEFFNNLKKNILKKIWIKEYPQNVKNNYCYNPIDKKINKSNIIYANKIKDSNITLDKYINSANLLVTNYLSTSYIQALISNKPTIIFFNSKSYFLEKKYKNFYKDLIKSKIMYSNPKEAANFINNNFNNLHDWWLDPLTQKCRNRFIQNNIKDANNMYDVITKFLSASL